MRRLLLPVAPTLALSLVLGACGGGGSDDGTGTLLSEAALAKQQAAVDEVARTAVVALVDDLAASPPSADSLGRGLFAGCENGDPDEAAYFVDTFVTYDVRPVEQATKEVAKAWSRARLSEGALSMTGSITARKGRVQLQGESQEKGGGSAGYAIFASSPCLQIGEKAIRAFNAANGRDVSLR